MKNKIIFLLLFILLMMPLSAHADWIMMENGDRLSGTIISQNSSTIELKHSVMGNLYLPKDGVSSVHKGQMPRVLARELNTGLPISVLTPAQNSPKAKNYVSSATPAEVKTGVINTTNLDEFKWSGRAAIGGNIQGGNTNKKSVTADIDAKARDPKNRFGVGAEANWAEDDGKKTDNDQQIYGLYDRFITDKWFIGGRQSLEKDEFEQIKLRSQSGLFTGYQFFEQEDLNLQIKAGPEYIYEEFEDGSNDGNLALGWALDYDQKLLENAMEIYHRHEIQSPFNDMSAFLFESESGVRVPIGKKLDASVQVDFDWDNDPIIGVVEDDTTYSVKLGYGW